MGFYANLLDYIGCTIEFAVYPYLRRIYEVRTDKLS